MPPETSSTERTLELRDVSKFFGDLVALSRVRLRIGPGDSVLLYGPNGAGKTTLLRLLATLARPSHGQVLFGGEDVRHDPVAVKKSLGFVSHATFLYGDLTPRENLEFTGALFALPQLPKRIDAILDLLDLRDRAGVRTRELSRGLQQRVALARAFLHDPQFLLLDEPFTGLDAGAAEALCEFLQRWPERGKALIFSTHDFEQGARLARRLVLLESGQVRYDGPLEQAPRHALGRSAGRQTRPLTG